MIYLKNNTETQSIYIPRQTVLGSGYIATTEKYEEGYNDGFKDGKEQQKGKLSNLNVTENGQYEREDGWNVVTVDVPDLNGSYDEGYAEGERVGYEQGKTDGINEQKGKLESINITENGTYDREDGYNHIEVNVPDLNGDYNEGYEQGKTEGEQEGYKQGQADIVAKARVLEVTENGVYKSKYSDPIMPTTVTGVYNDGTNFYSYAELNGKVFNTKIAGSVDSRLEFWYKGDNTLASNAWDVIIGSGDNDDKNCFQVRYYIFYNTWVEISIGNSTKDIDNWNDTVWHHLIISKAEGLWIDGEKRGDFSPSNTINGEFFINGIGHNINSDGLKNANGTFGMIKIDDTTIIPTANGFQNVNTGELLEVVKDGGYTFTEKLPIYGEGELYKTINVNIDVDSYYNNGYEQGKTDGISEQKSKLERINITENGTYSKEDGYSEVVVNVPDLNGSYDEGYDQGKADVVANARDIEVTKNGQYGDGETLYKAINVNVVPKVNVEKEGINFAYSAFAEVPKWADFDGITNMYHMFSNCGVLQTIPLIDTSKVTNMAHMFDFCISLQAIPQLDTSNVTNMNTMFQNCYELQTIPSIDTSNVTDMADMFYNCRSLVSLPALNAKSLIIHSYQGFFGYSDLSNLTDFGGFLNLKSSMTDDGNLKRLPNLTYQSCINVLNGLYDFTGNGETPNSYQGKLKVHQNFLDKVGEEISIGVAKGWTITA